MGKPVLITVTGTQVNECGDVDTQEFITTGNCSLKKDAYFLIYSESEITGMAGTTTSLKVEPGRVTLNRMGASQLKQVFETGLRYRSNYVTPHGSIYMAVVCSKVEANLTDSGGSINLEYVLEVENQKLSDNILTVTVREV